MKVKAKYEKRKFFVTGELLPNWMNFCEIRGDYASVDRLNSLDVKGKD